MAERPSDDDYEITRAMIDAGAEVLRGEYDPEDPEGREEVVPKIFRAMLARAPFRTVPR